MLSEANCRRLCYVAWTIGFWLTYCTICWWLVYLFPVNGVAYVFALFWPSIPMWFYGIAKITIKYQRGRNTRNQCQIESKTVISSPESDSTNATQ